MSDLRFRRFYLWQLLPFVILLLGTFGLGCRPSLNTVAGMLPPVIYVGQDDTGLPQLFRADVQPTSTTASQLTHIQNATLIDFAVAPSGFPVALSVETAAGGGIWLLPSAGAEISHLLECPQAECSGPVWSPDGRRLIYERRELSTEEGVAGRPHLWWLDTQTGETVPVLQNDHAVAHSARFSPDGSWLAYALPAGQGVEVYNLINGRRFLLPSEVGAAATWSHDGHWLVLSDYKLITYHGDNSSDHLAHAHDYEEAVQLYRVAVRDAAGARTLLSPPTPVDDAFPAWSPDDQWIAFGRKTPRAQSGRQLWLMRPDGSDARPLTTDPAVQHGPPHWSPDGRFLLFQRYQLAADNAAPEIWLLNVENSEMTLIAASGFLPAWLP